MSKKNHKIVAVLLCVCLLMLTFFVVQRLRNQLAGEFSEHQQSANAKVTSQQERMQVKQTNPVPQGHDKTGVAKKMDNSEQWIKPFEMDDKNKEEKFEKIRWALYAEFDLYVLEKYAKWTEEDRQKRFRELSKVVIRSEEVRQEESELIIFPDAWRREQSRTNPPADWAAADNGLIGHLSSPDTKQLQEMRRIRYKQQWTDKDLKAINQIVERLNQAITKNRSILTYWDDLVKSWNLPPPIQEGDFD